VIDSYNGFITLTPVITTATGTGNGLVDISFAGAAAAVPDHTSTITLLGASLGLFAIARASLRLTVGRPIADDVIVLVEHRLSS
jgi:hypothetical protein